MPWKVPVRYATAQCKRLAKPANLNWETRVIIGLLNMDIEPDRIATILGADLGIVRKFVEKVLSSRNRIIQEAVCDGLPTELAAKLPEGKSVRCQACNRPVNFVPCIVCSMQNIDGDVKFRLEDKFNWPLRAPKRPTKARPGSLEKIEVMRKRVERGQRPFHRRDEQCAIIPSIHDGISCDTVSQALEFPESLFVEPEDEEPEYFHGERIPCLG